MRSGGHVEDLLPAFALGSLDPGELEEVRRHLGRCRSCRAALLRWEEVVGTLALAEPPADPPAALKERVLAGPGPALSRGLPRKPGFRFPPSTRRDAVRAGALRAAAALAILALALLNVLLWQRVRGLERLTASLPAQVAALSGTGEAPGARGAVFYRAAEPRATLVAEGLPLPGAGRQYQLWLIRDGGRDSGGVFSVSPRGYGTLEVSAPLPLGAYQAFGVTLEPAGGSPGPTGPRVLGGRPGG